MHTASEDLAYLTTLHPRAPLPPDPQHVNWKWHHSSIFRTGLTPTLCPTCLGTFPKPPPARSEVGASAC